MQMCKHKNTEMTSAVLVVQSLRAVKVVPVPSVVRKRRRRKGERGINTVCELS
jgi:hypothetical protein